MNFFDAYEQAYKNGYEDGRNSLANQCVMCGCELPEEWTFMICKNCLEKWGDKK